ncbi:MAG: FliH/SctL family protein, partial [Planctomycetota bacterium]
MGVIKGDAAGVLARDAVVLDLADLSRQAEVILSTARSEAERIVAEGRAERARLIADAEAVGRNAGHEAGLREGRVAGEEAGKADAIAAHAERLTAMENAWSGALAEFVAEREDLLVACKDDVLRLAIMLAERVTHRVIETDTSAVIDQLAAALREVGSATKVVVAVHPGDAQLVCERLPALVGSISTIDHADLVEDAALTAGSCVIRTAAGGVIDASIVAQLGRMAELLLPGSVGARDADPPMQLDEDGQENKHDNEQKDQQ